MAPALRRAQILQRIQRNGGVSIAELARALDVSAITVHRDLQVLAKDGLVERVHGGARAVDDGNGPVRSSAIATAWEQRVRQATAAKAAMAAHAAAHVQDGATIFLDSSSSCLALARRLMAHPPTELTIVTNSPAIAYELLAEPIHVIVAPGELDQHLRMLTGRWTVEFLAELHFTVAFVSAAGVTLEAGLTTSRRPLADVVSTARTNAATCVGLMDASKFGRAALLTIVRAEELDAVVTDPDLPADVAERYRAAGVRLEVPAKEEHDG